MDEFDDLIGGWADAVGRFDEAMHAYAQAEAKLKHEEAVSKKRRMAEGASAAKAEAEMRAEDGWLKMAARVAELHANVETCKRIITLYQAKVDIERSRAATSRQLH